MREYVTMGGVYKTKLKKTCLVNWRQTGRVFRVVDRLVLDFFLKFFNFPQHKRQKQNTTYKYLIN